MTPEEEGRAAFDAGLLGCPYDGRSREARQWREGYQSAVAPDTEAEVFVAIQSGVARVDDRDVVFVAGVTRVRAGHPLLTMHPHLFRAVDAHYEVEQATAAPGEKRAR